MGTRGALATDCMGSLAARDGFAIAVRNRNETGLWACAAAGPAISRLNRYAMTARLTTATQTTEQTT